MRATIVGCGLAGALLAVLLSNEGLDVRVVERRDDPRRRAAERGRSINLAMAARGLRAIEVAGLMDDVRPLLLPMRGRMVHEPGRAPVLHPYGQRPNEVIWSVSRAELNRTLVSAAARSPRVQLEFGVSCTRVTPDGALTLRDGAGAVRELPPGIVLAADGAGSAVRRSLESRGVLHAREEPLDHDYLELAIPARDGEFALDRGALHVWPRAGFMLIALPNTDRSFTATLFLPREGPVSLAALGASAHGPLVAAREFFAREFADVLPLLPDLEADFANHTPGRLGTLHVEPWQVNGRVLLLGDAAHAIVPFHGQGMNAAFEDCVLLTELLRHSPDTRGSFAEYERRRRPDTEAIARMALENYAEMRARVLDPGFQRRRALGLELERRHPERFIPRYSMVSFHPEIGYAEALRRGVIQEEILAALDAVPGTADERMARADRLIAERLEPITAPAAAAAER